jgi:uncharacterized protein YjiS (DUF1127 family)
MSILSTRTQWREAARVASSGATDRFLALIRRSLRLIGNSLARSAERRVLREYADGNDEHLLRDIGITRRQAYREAAKWFWQR